jgi:hypothetical protein
VCCMQDSPTRGLLPAIIVQCPSSSATLLHNLFFNYSGMCRSPEAWPFTLYLTRLECPEVFIPSPFPVFLVIRDGHCSSGQVQCHMRSNWSGRCCTMQLSRDQGCASND